MANQRVQQPVVLGWQLAQYIGQSVVAGVHILNANDGRKRRMTARQA
jgi:hypothetical protein